MAKDYSNLIEECDQLIIQILTTNAKNISRRMQEEGDSFSIKSVEMRALLELRKITRQAQERREREAGTYTDPRTPDAKEIKRIMHEALKDDASAPTNADQEPCAPKANRAQRRAAARHKKSRSKLQSG